MASCTSNLSVTAGNFASGQVVFDCTEGATPDRPCSVFTVHNRDAGNYLQVAVMLVNNVWMVRDDSSGNPTGAAIPPGATIPFTAATQRIAKVVFFNAGSTVAADGFVEAM